MRRFKISILLLLCMLCTVGQAGEVYNNAMKLTFLSWLTGSTKLSYERAIANHQTAEICASMIGAGYDKFQNKPLGFTVRYGHKFFLSGNHDGGLQGFYVRPEAIYSHYSYNSSNAQARVPAKMGALLATMGYQININRLLIDTWVGGGYALGVPAETGYHHGFALWDMWEKNREHLALSFSVKLGFCF